MPDGIDQWPELSVVIPCFNEEDNAAAIAAAVVEQMDKVSNDFDILMTGPVTKVSEGVMFPEMLAEKLPA